MVGDHQPAGLGQELFAGSEGQLQRTGALPVGNEVGLRTAGLRVCPLLVGLWLCPLTIQN